MNPTATLHGLSRIAGRAGERHEKSFRAWQPTDGRQIDPEFFSASDAEVHDAVSAAAAAAPALARSSAEQRAQLLTAIAGGLDALADTIVERAHAETALPIARLKGELARTCNQLRFFAQVLEEGSWVIARIDTGDAQRTPPKPDIRSMMRPLGPVAVFGASNFPLAFSVAGGDTASALAAGNPVIVKAHAAHPGTSELVGNAAAEAVASSGFPAGAFSLLFDAGVRVGSALVRHPLVRAVGFTGSLKGGRAIMDLAAARECPIPVYAEMGSANPVFLLPGALRERGDAIATALHASFTAFGGQQCTKPGLIFLDAMEDSFSHRLRDLTAAGPGFAMLSGGIAKTYRGGLEARNRLQVACGMQATEGFAAHTALLQTDYDTFAGVAELHEELFGPSTLLIAGVSRDRMLAAARSLTGHLTATIHGTDEDLREYAELVAILETKAGRVIVNGVPTGVEIGHAMIHGGPYPATSDGRSTSVGSQAILRFARPVCYQNLPQSLLPPELQDNNPRRILRLWNGEWQLPQK